MRGEEIGRERASEGARGRGRERERERGDLSGSAPSAQREPARRGRLGALPVVRLRRGGERCRRLRVEEEVREVRVLGRPAVEEAGGIVHEGGAQGVLHRHGQDSPPAGLPRVLHAAAQSSGGGASPVGTKRKLASL